MRKSLIALACLSAVAGAATAAEVELYGTVDTYIAVNHNAGKTDVSLRSGGASASFWGIKGTEDIGPDLKAIFKLESAFLTDSGALPDGVKDDNVLFSREAWVGLHSNTWGTISFGRQYTPHFLTWAMTDPTDLSLGSAYSPFFFPMPTGVNGEVKDSLVRHDNSVLYVSQRMAGVQLFAYAALGEEKDKDGNITGSEDGNVYNIAANYVNGPLFVMASVLYQDYSGNQNTNLGYQLDGSHNPENPGQQDNGHGMYYNLGVTYDFGITKLSGAFMYKDGEDTLNIPNFWVAQVGAATPLWGGRWSVSAAMLSNETQDDADAYSFGTRYDYPLSKRTKIYAGYEVVFNDSNAKYSVEAGPDSSLHYTNDWGTTQGQFFMGINHKF